MALVRPPNRSLIDRIGLSPAHWSRQRPSCRSAASRGQVAAGGGRRLGALGHWKASLSAIEPVRVICALIYSSLSLLVRYGDLSVIGHQVDTSPDPAGKCFFLLNKQKLPLDERVNQCVSGIWCGNWVRWLTLTLTMC